MRRGYDKSFHSAFVALVLARFYRRLGMKVKAKQPLTPLWTTVSELVENTTFLTPHGRNVLCDGSETVLAS